MLGSKARLRLNSHSWIQFLTHVHICSCYSIYSTGISIGNNKSGKAISIHVKDYKLKRRPKIYPMGHHGRHLKVAAAAGESQNPCATIPSTPGALVWPCCG